MRKNLAIFLIIIVTFLLQTSFQMILPDAVAVPNLLLILTVSMGFMRGKKSGMWTGFVTGLIIDLFFGSYFGLTALLFMYIGYVNGFLYKIVFDDDARVPMITVFISDFIYNSVLFAVNRLTGGHISIGSALTGIILPEAVITMVVTIVFYNVYFWLNKKITAMELEEEQSQWLRR